MWSRVALSVVGAMVAWWTFAGSAQAGGWAVTTIDALPEGGFQAETPYRLGYMIRQHGQHPFDGAKTSIRITSVATGESKVFPGMADGPAGHYLAEVRFPTAGEWSWEVSQYPFGPQTLGTITVAPPASAIAATGASAWHELPMASSIASAVVVSAADWLSLFLPLATLLAFSLVALPVSLLMRRRRARPDLRVGRAAPGV